MLEEYSNDICITGGLSGSAVPSNIEKSLQIFSASSLPYLEELLLTKVQKIGKTKLGKSYFPFQIILIKWGKLLPNMKIRL